MELPLISTSLVSPSNLLVETSLNPNLGLILLLYEDILKPSLSSIIV